jgi:chemotaxis protein histidine kinase CheA
VASPPDRINPLKLKLGQPGPDAKSERVRRAQQAFEDLSPHYESWLENSLRRMETARDGFATDPASDYLKSALLRTILDVKGLGTMVGYPLITRVSTSLARILDSAGFPEVPPKALVDRHISAIRAIQQSQAKAPDSERFSQIATDLERDVVALRQKFQRGKRSKGSATKP